MDLNHICLLLNLDPLAQGLQIVEAAELARDFFPRLDTDRPALIANLGSLAQARRVRRTLLVNYPASHPVQLVQRAKAPTHMVGTFTRAVTFARTAVLFLPPLPEPSSPQTVAALVARLRAPGGCPWDRKQTHASLRRALLEETYEVIEAIDEHDPAHLQEEIGDVLLHVLFQTQIARDQNEFTLAQVCEELAAKLIRRHPHVFGKVQVANAAEVVKNWEQIKQEEKKAAGKQPAATLESNIPRELPALARAQKIYERARRQGLTFQDGRFKPLIDKIGRGNQREQMLGELLFALVAYAEENQVDSTSALRKATKRFVEKNK